MSAALDMDSRKLQQIHENIGNINLQTWSIFTFLMLNTFAGDTESKNVFCCCSAGQQPFELNCFNQERLDYIVGSIKLINNQMKN